jgi:uncharacterized membrane protein
MQLVRRRSRRHGAVLALAALVIAGCVQDLGSLGERSTVAVDVNERGVVVGYAYGSNPAVDQRAFRREPGGPLVDLTGAFDRSEAHAVNDEGVAVGAGWVGTVSDAVAWAPDGTVRSLGLGPDSVATDIADDGTIVGTRRGPAGDEGVVIDGETGAVEPLPRAHPGAAQGVGAVNDRGDVVGYEVTGGFTPVLWKAPDHTPVVLSSPVTGGFTTASDINDRGDVVGSWRDGRGFSGIALWWPARSHEHVVLPRPAGTAIGHAAGINNRGDVVGTTSPDRYTPGPVRAVRWSTHDVALPDDLGDLGGGASGAEAVDSAGAAVGWSETGEVHPDGSRVRHAARFPAPGGR